MTANTTPGRISVIMACYNAEPYVRDAVDSVLRQTYGDVELVVVDDGSTDRSREILHSYGNRIRLVEQANAGPYPARNNGVLVSTGQFVAFLDSDDYWSEDCLAKLHACLVESGAAVAYCGWQNVGLGKGRGDPFIPPDYEGEGKLERFLRAAAPWPIHAALLSRRVFDAVGGFDTQLGTCMDYDLWLRVGSTRPVARVPEVLAFYRHHQSGQITSRQWKQAENTWRVKRRFVATHPEAVSALSPSRLRGLIEGGLLRRGYDAYWRRDLTSAQRIFRLVWRTGGWHVKDMRYLLPALLPEKVYLSLIGALDRRGAQKKDLT